MQVLSKLRLITEKAKRDRALKFTSLIHHINEDLLLHCFGMLRKDAACGVDGVTVKTYGENLKSNIENLVKRLKSKQYRPLPVRRVYIPKPGKNTMRPLGIPSVEDKIVQMALKLILDALYEPLFLDSSHGFRPNLGCHSAIRQLDRSVMKEPTNYIVEVDIEKFFDTVDHYWLIKCLEVRICDPNFLGLIKLFLKAGIMEAGEWRASEVGSPQGGIVSPMLANIYLHYALDLWFKLEFKPAAKGYVELIRYSDDFVAACESEHDAKRFLEELEMRLAKFNLKISEEKTQILKFGRKAWVQAKRTGAKVKSFTFLGFTHLCVKSRNGMFMMGHKTSKQGLARKLKSVAIWLQDIRNVLPLIDWWPVLKAKLNGHYG